MTEAEYIAELKAHWPKGRTASREVLSLAAEAVRDCPQSATLWFLRGQLIRMAPPDYIFSKLDAICSFEEAIRLDPTFIEPCEKLGHSHERDDDAEPASDPQGKGTKGRGPRARPKSSQ